MMAIAISVVFGLLWGALCYVVCIVLSADRDYRHKHKEDKEDKDNRSS